MGGATKCHCGKVINTPAEQIDHTLKCDRFTRVSHYTRHNMVRDEFGRVCNLYGLAVTKEPNFYGYIDGKKRPDMSIHASQTVATDFTIVTPHDDPGHASKQADAEKKAAHTNATKALGHAFISAAAESYGLIGEEFTKLINHLTSELAPQFQWGFREQMTQGIATALARGRASAVFGAKWRNDHWCDPRAVSSCNNRDVANLSAARVDRHTQSS